MATIYLKTYGCQMNERDSEQVAQMLLERGHCLTHDEAEADVILINTCSVRDQAEQKALGKMGMMVGANRSRLKSHVVYGFLGCMAQSRGAELLKNSPGIDLVVGTQKFHRVADYVEELLERKRFAHFDDPRFSIVDVEAEENSQSTIRDHMTRERQATAFVSIMQGCNMRCAFCIVPQTRGPERSRPITDIVAEVESLVARGVREVTLLGQIVNLYGRHEFPRREDCSPFVQLLEAVHAVSGLQRLRFTSPHPQGFREDLVEAFARLPKLCSHVHFPLQSGSNRILRLMRRTYTSERYRDLAGALRRARPGLALTTDIIVGFPGETETDFQQTIDLVRELEFDNAFVFRYSPRRETPAANMPDQLPEAVKEERNQRLLAVVNEIARRKAHDLVGARVETLCEGRSKTRADRFTGRTSTNKVVIFDGHDRLIGQLLEVQIEETTGFTLYGTPVVRELSFGSEDCKQTESPSLAVPA